MTALVTTFPAILTPAKAALFTDQVVTLVTNAVESGNTRRAYERAIRDFMAWYLALPAGEQTLSKATVNAYRADLVDSGLSASSINQRLSAIRKMASEAADNNLLDQTLASGIGKAKGLRQEGRRLGNWLTKDQAQELLNLPDDTTNKGRRDRAALALLVGCGLRRDEAARLDWRQVQQRDGRWVIVDLVGKRGKLRSVPMPSWGKASLDLWGAAVGWQGGTLLTPESGPVLHPVNKGDVIAVGQPMTPQAIYYLVREYAGLLGVTVAPHDLRRTFAKLAQKGGAALEQIQLTLGHASIKTTERYLGIEQDLTTAPCDVLGLRLE